MPARVQQQGQGSWVFVAAHHFASCGCLALPGTLVHARMHTYVRTYILQTDMTSYVRILALARSA